MGPFNGKPVRGGSMGPFNGKPVRGGSINIRGGGISTLYGGIVESRGCISGCTSSSLEPCLPPLDVEALRRDCSMREGVAVVVTRLGNTPCILFFLDGGWVKGGESLT